MTDEAGTISRQCIFTPSKSCGYPNRLRVSPDPTVFIISSTDFEEIVSWFKEVFDEHIRNEDGTKFDVVFFTDLASWDFCSNVCIPIHESWFCIAMIKEELLPLYSERDKNRITSGFTLRLNPNVFFEVGLSLGKNKDVIVYLGKNQELPTDWGNLIRWVVREPSESLSPRGFREMTSQLQEIIKRDPFFGHHVKWV